MKASGFSWQRHFQAMKPHRVEFGGIMHADDLRALNAYMHSVTPKTDAARKLLSDWAGWWVAVGDPSNYMFLVPDEVWDEARNRRNAFNLANATTPQEHAQVQEVIKSGVTTEAARGEPERRDPNTGMFPIPPEPEHVWKKWWFWPAVGVGTAFLLPAVLRQFLPKISI